jgi:hypothetical protein
MEVTALKSAEASMRTLASKVPQKPLAFDSTFPANPKK